MPFLRDSARLALAATWGTFSGLILPWELRAERHSTPSYMGGGSTADPRVFLVGAGWGALGGEIAGIAYGIYGIIDHVNIRNKSVIKASIDDDDLVVRYNPAITGIEIAKKF